MTDPGAELRDQFFALWRERGAAAGPRDGEHEAALGRLLAASPTPAPTTRLQGLALSHCPGGRFRQLRFIAASELELAVRPAFARPCAALPELAAAFVDPDELSYHSFENILGLDAWFGALGPAPTHLTRLRRLPAGVLSGRLQVSAPLAARLAQLDALGLYVRPYDPARGGQRFIFHSAELAAALTAALRESLPRRSQAGFVAVNPVFRCNRFEPGDPPFATHVDSPYYDRSRHHVSKHTLLIYLSAGDGDGGAALRFVDGPTIPSIAAMTAFVFPQQLAHEGRPYLAGRKLFLRTELIYADPRLEHTSDVAELFARACYLGTQPGSAPELAALAHEAYDRAAAAHWRGPPEPAAERPYLHKSFRGAHFVTDGHDYWFDLRALTLPECAALALLDLLNAAVDGAPFRQLCRSTVLIRGTADRSWIAALLAAQAPAEEPVFARLNKQALFPEPEEPLATMDFPGSPDFHDDPFPDDWDATRNPRVLAVYTRARRWALQRIFAAPITVLGKQLFLDPARFVVIADKVHILSSERLDPVHFAGASFFGPDDFVGVDVTLGALQPLVPPMSLGRAGDLLHLRCDLFRNSWMVSHRSETVPVPRVLDGRDVDTDASPWLTAAGLDLARLRAETSPDED